MAFCWNCGKEMSEEQLFCLYCGAPANPNQYSEPKVENKKRGLNVGQLIFSIINLICCCTVMGIIALVFTLVADGEEEEKAKKHIKTAMILNIVGLCVGIVVVIAWVLIVTLGILTESGAI